MKKAFLLIVALLAIAGLLALVLYLMWGKPSHKSADNDEDIEYASLFRGEEDRFALNDGSELTIYSIKHGSIAINVAEKWIYIDPVTSAALPETDYGILPKADYILFTHNHLDHFDTLAVSQLKQEATTIIANESTIAQLGYGVILHNGESKTTDDGWLIDAVPAYNNSPEKLQFHPRGRDNGYVLSIAGLRIYIAGDTEVIPELADIKDIDVAFLPCNLPFTMDPEQCAAAAKVVCPKVLFPYHYGGVNGESDLQALIDLLDGSGIEVRIRKYA